MKRTKTREMVRAISEELEEKELKNDIRRFQDEIPSHLIANLVDCSNNPSFASGMIVFNSLVLSRIKASKDRLDEISPQIAAICKEFENRR